jgi:gas vesicle protein
MALNLEAPQREGRVNERTAVLAGTIAGAAVGITVAYLFFTERGRGFRERLEPTIDDLRQDFARFQKTIEKVGAMANDGVRVFQDFSAARSQRGTSEDVSPH